MTYPHLANILVHVLAGLAGMALGALILFQPKGSAKHKRLGHWFLLAVAVVCASAALGSWLFRFIPLFATLTVLVSYVSITGWRNIKRMSLGPNRADALILLAAVVCVLAIAPALLEAARSAPRTSSVLVSSLAALGFVLAYDFAKFFFPKRWHAHLWRYEHIYRMCSALFGMVSAALGNLLQTLAGQLLPIPLGFAVIGYYFFLETRRANAQASIPQ